MSHLNSVIRRRMTRQTAARPRPAARGPLFSAPPRSRTVGTRCSWSPTCLRPTSCTRRRLSPTRPSSARRATARRPRSLCTAALPTRSQRRTWHTGSLAWLGLTFQRRRGGCKLPSASPRTVDPSTWAAAAPSLLIFYYIWVRKKCNYIVYPVSGARPRSQWTAPLISDFVRVCEGIKNKFRAENKKNLTRIYGAPRGVARLPRDTHDMHIAHTMCAQHAPTAHARLYPINTSRCATPRAPSALPQETDSPGIPIPQSCSCASHCYPTAPTPQKANIQRLCTQRHIPPPRPRRRPPATGHSRLSEKRLASSACCCCCGGMTGAMPMAPAICCCCCKTCCCMSTCGRGPPLRRLGGNPSSPLRHSACCCIAICCCIAACCCCHMARCCWAARCCITAYSGRGSGEPAPRAPLASHEVGTACCGVTRGVGMHLALPRPGEPPIAPKSALSCERSPPRTVESEAESLQRAARRGARLRAVSAHRAQRRRRRSGRHRLERPHGHLRCWWRRRCRRAALWRGEVREVDD